MNHAIRNSVFFLGSFTQSSASDKEKVKPRQLKLCDVTGDV